VSAPLVSVLMPTYRQAAFIRRALASLHAQTLHDWELVVLDDGSPDETPEVLAPYRADSRVRVERLARNGGLGAALNEATRLARGRYLAYLPSDDLFYPEHLARLATLLDARPEVYLAYGGLRFGYNRTGETPEWRPQAHGPVVSLAPRLVQVMHRRDLERQTPWPTRAAIVSDTLESDQWKALAERGATLAYAGDVTCEWTDHPDQRHKIIAGKNGGITRYRTHYGVGGVQLNWQPSNGPAVDERVRYARLGRDEGRGIRDEGSQTQLSALKSQHSANTQGLTILLAGSLGFNPERVLAFEERGHRLLGLWNQTVESWDMAGPLPFGGVEDIPLDARWRERVLAAQPDVIYALLNWHALPLVNALLDAKLGIPIVFHFKEGPFICLEHGTWPQLVRVLRECDGRIFINQECYDWFQLATDSAFDPETTFVLDGDLPKADWMTDEWTPKLSAQDGEIHTVCPGRPLGLDPFEGLAAAGIHVHFYGRHFQQLFPNWTKSGLATGYMHLHGTVEPHEWVRELSQYDAAWLHVFESTNAGDLRRARWDDLNLPARLGTYAAAGLPWIMRDNRGSRVAVQRVAEASGFALTFRDFEHLGARLRDRAALGDMTAAARAARRACAFDTHVDALVEFFERVAARRR
jgi:hypothetical protein